LSDNQKPVTQAEELLRRALVVKQEPDFLNENVYRVLAKRHRLTSAPSRKSMNPKGRAKPVYKLFDL
jgi:hypothetical protein